MTLMGDLSRKYKLRAFTTNDACEHVIAEKERQALADPGKEFNLSKYVRGLIEADGKKAGLLPS